MEINELLDVIANGETTKVQFKRDVNNVVSISQEMVAFANTSGIVRSLLAYPHISFVNDAEGEQFKVTIDRPAKPTTPPLA
jgi:hypothetical protein